MKTTRPFRYDLNQIPYDYTVEVRNQDIPEVTGKSGLGVKHEAEQGLTELCQENTLVIVNTLFQQHKR